MAAVYLRISRLGHARCQSVTRWKRRQNRRRKRERERARARWEAAINRRRTCWTDPLKAADEHARSSELGDVVVLAKQRQKIATERVTHLQTEQPTGAPLQASQLAIGPWQWPPKVAEIRVQ